MISIIIPCKDRAENTKRILNELIRQRKKYPQTEIIVVENNSVEDMSFLDTYDIICVHGTGKGDAYARNTGLDLCTGEYVAFIDNDDMIPPYYLDVIYEHIPMGYDWYVWQWAVDNREVLMADLDVKNPLRCNWALWGYLFNRRLLNGVRFDESKQVGSDYKIFEIITEKTRGYFIKRVMYFFKWEGNDDSLSHLFNSGKITGTYGS